VFLILSISFGYFSGLLHNNYFKWNLSTASEKNLSKDIIDNAINLQEYFGKSLNSDNWVIMRNIQNLTTGENITVEMSNEDKSNPALFRSSVIINSPPSEVAKYFAPLSKNAQDKKVKTWGDYSSILNLARIETYEVVPINGPIPNFDTKGDFGVLIKQIASPVSDLLGHFISKRYFTQGLAYIDQKSDILAKEFTVANDKSFDIPKGTKTLISYTINHENPEIWGGLGDAKRGYKDTVYWFIPIGKSSTRLVAVSRYDIGILRY